MVLKRSGVFSEVHPSAQTPSMKKKSTSQSAFFNLRVLIGLFVFLAGVFLALLGFGAFSNLFAQRSAAARQSAAACPGPISRRHAGSEVRYLAAVARHEAAGRKGMHAARRTRSSGPIPLRPSGRSSRIMLRSRCSARLEYRGPSSASMDTATSAAARRRTRTERSVPIMSSRWSTCIFKSSIRPGHRSSVRQRTIRSGLDLVATARPITLAIQSSSTTSSQTAGCSPSLLPVARRTLNVWRFHRRTIRWDLITDGRSRQELIFPIIPKAGVWPDAYYFSTREFANGAVFVGVGAYALDRAQALVGNPNPTIVGFLVPPGGTPYNIGDGLLPSDLDGTTPPPGPTAPTIL